MIGYVLYRNVHWMENSFCDRTVKNDGFGYEIRWKIRWKDENQKKLVFIKDCTVAFPPVVAENEIVIQ